MRSINYTLGGVDIMLNYETVVNIVKYKIQ